MLLCIPSLPPPRRQLGDWGWVCRGAVGGRSNFWVCGRDTASRAQTRGRAHHVTRYRKGSWVFPVTGSGTFGRGRGGGWSRDAAAASPAGVAGVPGSGVGELRGLPAATASRALLQNAFLRWLVGNCCLRTGTKGALATPILLQPCQAVVSSRSRLRDRLL